MRLPNEWPDGVAHTSNSSRSIESLKRTVRNGLRQSRFSLCVQVTLRVYISLRAPIVGCKCRNNWPSATLRSEWVELNTKSVRGRETERERKPDEQTQYTSRCNAKEERERRERFLTKRMFELRIKNESESRSDMHASWNRIDFHCRQVLSRRAFSAVRTVQSLNTLATSSGREQRR